MPSRIYPDGSDPETYQGLSSIYEFINSDGRHRKFNCGQAAACTFLTHHRIFSEDPSPEKAREMMTEIEKDHPPDNAGGWFGSSKRRVERICRTFGIEIEDVHGEEQLKKHLQNLQPVVVMVGTEGRKLLGMSMPAGHWMVAYGFDKNQLFLTNYSGPGMPWEEFRRWWNSLIPSLISMKDRGIAAVQKILDPPSDLERSRSRVIV